MNLWRVKYTAFVKPIQVGNCTFPTPPTYGLVAHIATVSLDLADAQRVLQAARGNEYASYVIETAKLLGHVEIEAAK